MNDFKPQGVVDHLFRSEYGKMVSILVRVFGPAQLNLVEDAVQDAFIKAISTWREGKIPDNPAAWLHRVARNKAIDLLRTSKNRSIRHEKYIAFQPFEERLTTFLDTEIEDSQLRLIFTCCNLDLNEADKIALTLKVISGLGIKEISKALMVKEETIKKRLHRAKSKLKALEATVELPTGKGLSPLIETVHKVIYLLFNEGYNSSQQNQLIRKDLCSEAMRLCKLVSDHKYCTTPAGNALMALMCYHSARFESRLTQDHTIILLKDQDRSKWYKPLINIGNHYFGLASQTNQFSIYHIEAAIAAQHARASSIDTTDYTMLEKLYGLLDEVSPSSLVKLNLAICRKENKNLKGALDIIESLKPTDFNPNPYLYHAVAAEVYKGINDAAQAVQHLRSSLENAPTESERNLMQRRLSEYEQS